MSNGQASLKWDAGHGWNGDFGGQAQAGKPHGVGMLKADDGEKEYYGHFLEGKLHGQGVAVYDELDQYTGEWEGSLYHGHGVLSYHSSSKYEGQWRQGERHGYGIFYPSFNSSDGARYGKWSKDEFVEELPKEKVKAVLEGSRKEARQALEARVADLDAGLLTTLKSGKYSPHGASPISRRSIANQRLVGFGF